jgi:hypothetical protein
MFELFREMLVIERRRQLDDVEQRVRRAFSETP